MEHLEFLIKYERAKEIVKSRIGYLSIRESPATRYLKEIRIIQEALELMSNPYYDAEYITS